MLNKYNTFEHLHRSVFPIGATERLMVMLTAYCDESGTDGRSPLVAVGGYISTVDLWDSFQIEWQKFLDNNEIVTFHATDLMALRNEFSAHKGWTNNRAKSALRIADRIIKNHTLYAAAAYTTIADCEKHFPLKDGKLGSRKKFSIEYVISSVMVNNLFTTWAEGNGYTDPIQLVYEHGVNGRGWLSQATDFTIKSGEPRGSLIGGISFEKKGLVQLQAADRLVHLACRSINRFLEDETASDPDRLYLNTHLNLQNVHAMDCENFPLLMDELDTELGAIYEKESD